MMCKDKTNGKILKIRMLYKYTAHNERFHASGGVCPLKHLWEFGSLSPARTFVNPRLREAATTLAASGAQNFRATWLRLTTCRVIQTFLTWDNLFKFVGSRRVRYALHSFATPKPKNCCAIYRLCPPPAL